jgi:hypothetical protein
MTIAMGKSFHASKRLLLFLQTHTLSVQFKKGINTEISWQHRSREHYRHFHSYVAAVWSKKECKNKQIPPKNQCYRCSNWNCIEIITWLFILDPWSALDPDISGTYFYLLGTRKYFRKLTNNNVIPITESPGNGCDIFLNCVIYIVFLILARWGNPGKMSNTFQ